MKRFDLQPDRSRHHAFSFPLMIVFCLIAPALCASEPAWTVSVGPSAIPFVAGRAGSGSSAPGYGDAFDTGYGMQLELGRRVAERAEIVGGVAYHSHSGKTLQGFAFGDLDVTPIYVGGRYRLANGTKWRLEALADVGSARLSSVDVSFGNTTVRYWESSWVLMWDLGGALSLHGTGPWSMSLRAAYRSMGKPDAAFGQPSEADSSESLPISVLLNYRF